MAYDGRPLMGETPKVRVPKVRRNWDAQLGSLKATAEPGSPPPSPLQCLVIATV
jgi:hypothetical protein